MTNQDPQSLLEDTHSFPGKFTFKVIGKANDEFALRAVAVVRAALEQEFDPSHELRNTAGGRHVAVTIEAWVESSEQVIGVFAALRDLEGLVMML